MNTYTTHKLDSKNMEEQKKLAKDLRNHHFSYGNEERAGHLTTINRDDYKNNPINLLNEDKNSYLKENHFSVGDVTDKTNIYQTTYGNSIGFPKGIPERATFENNSFKTTYLLKVDEKPEFLTESRVK